MTERRMTLRSAIPQEVREAEKVSDGYVCVFGGNVIVLLLIFLEET